jgi:lactoylglutathione lyase
MKFCWTTLYVKNMEESLRFYQEIIDLKVERKFRASPEMEIAFLGDGETKVELVHNETHKETAMGHDISLGFEVASLDKTIQMIKDKGIPVHSGPFQPNPHIRFFYVLDPNGLKIQFVENM